MGTRDGHELWWQQMNGWRYLNLNITSAQYVHTLRPPPPPSLLLVPLAHSLCYNHLMAVFLAAAAAAFVMDCWWFNDVNIIIVQYLVRQQRSIVAR